MDSQIEITDDMLLNLRAELTALRFEAPYFVEQIDACVWAVPRMFIPSNCPDPFCVWCTMTAETWNQMQNAEYGTHNSEHIKTGEKAKYNQLEYTAFLIVTRDIGLRLPWARALIEAMLFAVIKAHVHAACTKAHCWICTSKTYAEMRSFVELRPVGQG